jgi:hypothetical protein
MIRLIFSIDSFKELCYKTVNKLNSLYIDEDALVKSIIRNILIYDDEVCFLRNVYSEINLTHCGLYSENAIDFELLLLAAYIKGYIDSFCVDKTGKLPTLIDCPLSDMVVVYVKSDNDNPFRARNNKLLDRARFRRYNILSV